MYGFGIVCSIEELETIIKTLVAETRRQPLYADDVDWTDPDNCDECDECDEYDEYDEAEALSKIYDVDGCPYSCPYVDENLKGYCPVEMGMECLFE